VIGMSNTIIFPNEMKQSRLQAKLITLRVEFHQAGLWINHTPLEKWTQTYDNNKRYGHM